MEVATWDALVAARATVVDDALAEVMRASNAPGVISFAGGFPNPETFPWRALPAALAAIVDARDPTAFQYPPVPGLPSTLDWLAGRLERLDGARPGDGELLLTSGGIEAMQLVGTAFLEPGDLVVCERPTYLGAIMGFRAAGARLEAVALDDDGLRVEELETLLAGGARPKLVYTIPDHQNPAGVSLSAERRAALVELARRHGFLVVEDVAYRELRFDGELEPTLRAHGPDVVLQIGTFSKTLFPGARLGWAAGPREVCSRLIWAKQLSDQGAGALAQRLAEEVGRSGLLDEQIARSRALYARRWQLTRASLEAHLGGLARWTEPTGGFFTWLTLERGGDTSELARHALEAGVSFVPGRPFFPGDEGGANLRLAFSLAPEDRIDEGIERLGRLIAG
ncbi:MAG TPA: PLP-dependent aminotransferase family protein [Gaiellaceae bacterium]|nr:PLP-dependent aminotransferase family protein [Gaiellaceae bacterium]